MAAERTAGRLNPYFAHLMVPMESSTRARLATRRSLTFPVTGQGAFPSGATPTSRTPGRLSGSAALKLIHCGGLKLIHHTEQQYS
jgi:hypothetical protein